MKNKNPRSIKKIMYPRSYRKKKKIPRSIQTKKKKKTNKRRLVIFFFFFFIYQKINLYLIIELYDLL